MGPKVEGQARVARLAGKNNMLTNALLLGAEGQGPGSAFSYLFGVSWIVAEVSLS
jgi:hypothetical protein